MPGLLPNVRSELELGGVAIDRFTSPFGCGLGISYLRRDDKKKKRKKMRKNTVFLHSYKVNAVKDLIKIIVHVATDLRCSKGTRSASMLSHCWAR